MDVILFLLIFFIFGWFGYDYITYRKYMREQTEDSPSTNPIPEKLILRRNFTNTSPGHQKKTIIISTLILLFVMASIFTVFIVVPVVDAPEHEQTEVLNKLISNLSTVVVNDPFNLSLLILFFLSIPVSFLIPRYIQDEKMILDKQGISYHSPFPDFLKFLSPNWAISWSKIDQIILGNSMVIGTLAIHEAGTNTKRRLIPATWKIKAETSTYNGFFVQGKESRRVMNDKDYIMGSPMIQYINKYTGINIETNKIPNSIMSFYLAEQKETKIIFSYLVGILIFTFIGFTSISHMGSHAAVPSWLIFSPAIIVTICSFFYLQKKKIPKAITIALPLLMGVTSAFACYPGSLLINRLTDTEGLTSYQYTKTNTTKFSPVTHGLPVIKIDRFEFENALFWASFKNGDNFEFQLRKGVLGFYQVATEPLYAKFRHWHCMQGVKNHGHDPKGCDES